MSWETLALGDAGAWISGGTPSTSNALFWGGDLPWMSSKSMVNFRIRDSDRSLTPLGVAGGTKVVPKDAILMVVRGMSLKTEFRMGIAQRPVALSQDLKGLIARPDLDPLFLAYAIKSRTPEILDMVDEAGHGTGRLQTDRLFELNLPKPPLEEQRAIAATLGALDDKIESNRRLFEICLDLAQARYLRACAEGASSMPLKETGRWLSGGTPSTSEPAYWGGDLPWLSAASIRGLYLGESDRRLTEAGRSVATNVVPRGSVVLVVRGMSLKSEFRFGVTQREVAFGQDCKAILPTVPVSLIVLALHSTRDRILDLVDEAGHGTGRLSTDLLEQHPVSVPNDGSVVAVLDRLLERSAVAAQESRDLGALRDALLPELLSGRMRVADSA